MNRLLVFNLAMLALCAAPRRLYAGFLRGIHLVAGIREPEDRQLRWVLIVWIFIMLLIVDGIAFMLDLAV